MAKKKRNKKKTDESLPLNPLASEDMMQDIQRLLADQDFESTEEINEFLQQQLASGSLPTSPHQPLSDLERAQNFIYEAYEARTKTRQLKLVRLALDISPDIADAYVLLAQFNTKTHAEAWAFYEAGVKAGERALGEDFHEYEGHFWGVIETRPYMRARMGLATTLWQMRRLQEAADHMEAMLMLNPSDNQGVRYIYITLLLELDDTKRMKKLLKEFPDDWSAYWEYGCALFEFKQTARKGKADELLSDAITYNSHVASYLLGDKKIPKTLNISYYSPGDENEALSYVVDGIRPWRATTGALDWLREIRDKASD